MLDGKPHGARSKRGRSFSPFRCSSNAGRGSETFITVKVRLNQPAELRGKRFGCFRYGATAVVWARGDLLDAHDIHTTDMQWFVSGREVFIGHELPVKSSASSRASFRRREALSVQDVE